MVLVRGLAVARLLVGEVVLLVQRGKDLASGWLASERSGHDGSHPRQKCGLK